MALPDELWVMILSYLDRASLLNLSETNHHFYRLALDGEVWKALTCRDFPEQPLTRPYHRQYRTLYSSQQYIYVRETIQGQRYTKYKFWYLDFGTDFRRRVEELLRRHRRTLYITMYDDDREYPICGCIVKDRFHDENLEHIYERTHYIIIADSRLYCL